MTWPLLVCLALPLLAEDAPALRELRSWAHRQGLRAEAAPLPGPTERARKPSSQAVGSYTKGSLLDAAALPPEGPGFVKIERLRRRQYGTDELIAALQAVGAGYAASFQDAARVQVGDLSAQKGGEVDLHSSHENGLDVDVAVIASDEREQDPEREGFDEDFAPGDGPLSPRFDPEKNWHLLKLAVLKGGAQRVFLSPRFKELFCARYAGQAEASRVLRALRPAAHHSEHFHVRLPCPMSDKRCVPQGPPPEGTGCARLEPEKDELVD